MCVGARRRYMLEEDMLEEDIYKLDIKCFVFDRNRQENHQ